MEVTVVRVGMVWAVRLNGLFVVEFDCQVEANEFAALLSRRINIPLKSSGITWALP